MKKIALILLTLSFLTACNTMEGFGADVKKVGGKIEKAADK